MLIPVEEVVHQLVHCPLTTNSDILRRGQNKDGTEGAMQHRVRFRSAYESEKFYISNRDYLIFHL